MRDPVWTLVRRRISTGLAYWLSAMGYDLKDRSISNRAYFIYFLLFWLAWFVAVFALLGGGIASFLNLLQPASANSLIVSICVYGLILWLLIQLWLVTHRSPFVFSEEDAYLLCMTPVSRQKVSLGWFLQGWLATAVPMAVVVITFSFGIVDLQFQGTLTFAQIASYLAASLHALVIILPFQLGLQAALWAIGAFRLRPGRNTRWYPLIAIFVILVFLIGFLISPLHNALVYIFRFFIANGLPGNTPGNPLWIVLTFSLLMMFLGVLLLVWASRRIHLGQAARETSRLFAMREARSYMQTDVINVFRQRKRLGTHHSPSKLLVADAGGGILFRKDLLQSLRGLKFGDVINWLVILGLAFGMFLSLNWGLQLVIAGFWTVRVGILLTQRLRRDIARWWIIRSLPIRSAEIFRYDLALLWGICTFMSWLAAGFAGLSIIDLLYSLLLLPILAASAGTATASDILRRSKTRVIMSPSIAEENVPQPNVLGVLQALVSTLIPFGIFVGSRTVSGGAAWGWISLPVAVFILLINVNFLLSAYRWIE
jgi:hypothetical protein